MTTRLGKTEVFEVVVGGTPKPEVQWMRGDKELKKGKRMLFEEAPMDDGTVKYKLTVKDIDMKDFGEVSRDSCTPLPDRPLLKGSKENTPFQWTKSWVFVCMF